jgi:hypothetical protein
VRIGPLHQMKLRRISELAKLDGAHR